MIDIMIEEVQDLHQKVYGIDLTVDELKNEYQCDITTLNITQLRNQLVILHQQMLFGEIGMFNANDI